LAGDQDEDRGGRRKSPADGVPSKEIRNRWPTVQVPANEAGTASQDFENSLCSKSNRRLITQWPTVLAMVLESRTGGEHTLDVPFAFEVLGTDAHSAFSCDLIAYFKRLSVIIPGHSTTFVLTAAR
jgi:hypothetical protein